MFRKILAWVLILSGGYSFLAPFWSEGVIRTYGYYAPLNTWVTSALWIAVGIGLLRLQRWARWLALGYCGLAVLSTVIVVPVLLFFAGGLKTLEGVVPIGKLPGFLQGIPGTFVLMAVWTIASGILAFIVLREIRPAVGLHEFGEEEKAKHPPEPFWNVIVSAIAWIVVGVTLPDDVRIASRAQSGSVAAASQIPKDASPAVDESRRLGVMMEMVGRANLTADGEHVAFVSSDVDDVYVLRLNEGDLVRTRRHPYALGNFPPIDRMVSANGSVLLYPDGTLQSLVGAGEKKLQSFNRSLQSESLGFVDASRVLAFQGKGALQLIDTATDRVTWSADVGMALAGWANRVSGWSSTRRWLAWSGADGVSLLNVESGQVRALAPPAGGGAAALQFSADERSLLVQHITAAGESSTSGDPNTAIFDIASGEQTALKIPGMALYNGGIEGQLMAFNVNSRALYFRPSAQAASDAWQAQFPARLQIAAVGAEGLLLASQSESGSSSGQLMYALQANEPRNGKILFRPVDVGRARQPHWLLRRGSRYVVLTEGTRVQVYDVAPIGSGAPTVSSIDLMTERKLSEAKAFEPLAEVLAIEWARATNAAPGSSMAAPISGTASPPNAASPPATAVPGSALTERAEKPDPNAIVKCRDAGGAMVFARGICPPGSTAVDAPAIKEQRSSTFASVPRPAPAPAAAPARAGAPPTPVYVSPRDVQIVGTPATMSASCGSDNKRRIVIGLVNVKLPSGEIKTYYKGAADRLYPDASDAEKALCGGDSR